MKFTTKNLPTPSQSWQNFPWDRFPGGVKVTFVLVDDRTGSVNLSRPTRWSYEMPSVDLPQDGTLDGLLGVFNQKMGAVGMQYRCAGEMMVLGGIEISNTLHVVAKVPTFGVAGSFEAVQPDKAYQVESGLALSNPVCEFVPAMLGWSHAKWVMNEVAVEETAA